MTTDLRTSRARTAGQIVIAALCLAVLAFITVSINARSLQDEPVAGFVAPELESRLDSVRTVRVVSSDDAMTMARTEEGWVMRERGDFPVSGDRLGELVRGLQEMRFERRMTADPAKLDRIGLGDPAEGGRGVLVQLEDENGAFVVDLIVGVETDAGGLYARRAGETQAYAVSGELPALRNRADWLAIAPIPVEPTKIVRVDLTPPTGRAYSLIPLVVGEQTGFSFAPPLRGVAPRSNLELQDLAGRLGQIEAVDVAPAASIQAAPVARIAVVTTDNIIFDGVIAPGEGELRWLKLSARATVDTPEAQAAAAAINSSAGQWAYGLSPTAFETLVPVYETLLPEPPPTAPPAPFGLTAP